MIYKDVLELVSETLSQDDYGEQISTKTSRQVSCNKKSVRQSEFYAANAAGMKPSIVFEVVLSEYNDETLINYNGKEYRVVRTYAKDSNVIELVCEKFVSEA